MVNETILIELINVKISYIELLRLTWAVCLYASRGHNLQ